MPRWQAVGVVVAAAQVPLLILRLVGVGGGGWGLAHLLAVLLPAAAALLLTRHAPAIVEPQPQPQAEELAPPVQVPDHTAAAEQVAAPFVTVARRGRDLVQSQMAIIDALEDDEEDPDVLRALFALDHVSNRMNRELASVLVLAGASPHRAVPGTPRMSEVLRGAMSEVRDFARVEVQVAEDPTVDGAVVGPLVHLLGELVQNAETASRPDGRVRVHGSAIPDGGYTVTVADDGPGMPAAVAARLNALLASSDQGAPTNPTRLGLHVVATLARQLGLRVGLAEGTAGAGAVATVRIPAGVLADGRPARVDPDPPTPPASAGVSAADAPAQQQTAAPFAPAPAVAHVHAPSQHPTVPTSPPVPATRSWSFDGKSGSKGGPRDQETRRRRGRRKKGRQEAQQRPEAEPAAVPEPTPVPAPEPDDLVLGAGDIDALIAASGRAAPGAGGGASQSGPDGPATTPADLSGLDAAAALLADLPSAMRPTDGSQRDLPRRPGPAQEDQGPPSRADEEGTA